MFDVFIQSAMVLVLPEDIKDQVGCGSLIIELETDIREEEGCKGAFCVASKVLSIAFWQSCFRGK